jgi:hypothetical protein
MSRVLCFKAQDANCSFRLSWATSAIRFRHAMGRFNGYGKGRFGLRTLESPLHPISRSLSKVAVFESATAFVGAAVLS